MLRDTFLVCLIFIFIDQYIQIYLSWCMARNGREWGEGHFEHRGIMNHWTGKAQYLFQSLYILGVETHHQHGHCHHY